MARGRTRGTLSGFKRGRAADRFESELRAEIEEGRLAPGDLILSISEICARYGLKQGSVQKALGRLAAAGYVTSRHGSGTFVSDGFRKATVRVYVSSRSPMLGFLAGCASSSEDRAELTDDRSAADVLCGPGIDTHRRGEAGGLRALDDRVRGEPSLTDSDWLPGVWERYRAGGRTYAVPIYASPIVLFYNRELFAKAKVRAPGGGWRWSDLLSAVERLRSVCDTEEAGVLPFLNQFSLYVPFLVQNGTGVFSASDRCVLAERRAMAAIAYLRRVRKASGGVVCGARAEFWDRFCSGRSAMMMWSGHTARLLEEQAPFRWGWAPLPRQRQRATLFLSEGMSIAASSSRQDAAWSFILDCVSRSAQAYFVERHFPFGARVSGAEAFIGRHGKSYRRLLDELDVATTEHYRFPDVFPVLNREMEGFLESDKSDDSVRTQVEQAVRVIDSMIGASRRLDEQLIA